MVSRRFLLALVVCSVVPLAGALPTASESADTSSKPSLDPSLPELGAPTGVGPIGVGSQTTRTAAAEPLIQAFRREAPKLDPEVLTLALDATSCARTQGLGPNADTLVVIDYSLPSVKKRLWVFDLRARKLLHRELVAHGKGTGENWAVSFSNTPESKQTSLGLFVTGRTYIGRNGYSLRLHGLEEGVNHLAFERTIVMHGAWYVTEDFARQHGRLGRSWGCPALRPRVARKVIDRIKDGRGLIFSYARDAHWRTQSPMLACGAQSPIQRAEQSAEPALAEPVSR